MTADESRTPAASTGVLARIVARSRADVALREASTPLGDLEVDLTPSTRDFAAALLDGARARAGVAPALIAEFKPRSPSAGALRVDARVEDIVPIYARVASAISVLCDEPFFGGGFDKLKTARGLCDLPLLCKDFVVGRYQIAEARRAGADSVLLMASVLDDAALADLLAYARALGMEPLVESHTDVELERALDVGARVVGVNSRDLKTLEIDVDAMERRLERVPNGLVRVAESGINTREGVARLAERAEAVLIGSALMSADDPARRLAELGWDS